MTSTTQTLLKHLPDLPLSRLGNDETEAGLWIASLPWPRTAVSNYSLNSQSTYNQPLGQWPGEPGGSPRRLLMIADGGNSAPETIGLSQPAQPAFAEKMSAEMELFERSPYEEYVWERHLLRLRYGSKSVGLAMGLRTGDEVHWWEACRLLVREETDQCLVVEMGGAIPLHEMTFEEFKSPGYTNPYLHRHHWLNGQIYARLHANGVCEVFAHHINSKFFDDGADLKNAVPVIGIQTEAGIQEVTGLCGDWDGSQNEIALGQVRFDMTETARLATPQQPGKISVDGDFLVLQPYLGFEIFGGACPIDLTGDPFVVRAQEQLIPRGGARTLRFSLSFSDRSPRVARYQAPAWWYGLCEEFVPEPLLPVSNAFDKTTGECSQWIVDNIVQGGFEDGSIPRNASQKINNEAFSGRDEPGWEGEIGYGEFMYAWRTGDEQAHLAALRSGYYITDVSVDHAVKAVRMHGFLLYGFSVPMNRMQVTIAAYLETGDPYLLETAQAVTATAYWTHKNSWPRMAVGRDACFVRSAVLLYRYFGTEFFREIARDGAHDSIAAQRENGSFGDQGGGTGIHQWAAYITKPWMGLLATGGVLDYLELFPDEPVLLEGVRKFADWLMEERFDHDGVMTWSYQHDFNGGRVHYQPSNSQHQILPGPAPWHQDNLGRLLTYCALRFDEPAYFDAWAQSYAGKYSSGGDHAVSASLQFIPWIQARLWQARLTEEGVETSPAAFAGEVADGTLVFTPEGLQPVELESVLAS